MSADPARTARDLDAYAEAYLRAPFEEVQAMVRREVVLERIAVHAPRLLLEVGCGTAPLATALGDDVRSIVVEPAAPFAEAARSLLEDGHLVIESTLEDAVERGPLEHLGKQRSVDVVVVSSLLHEVPHPARLLQAVRACCSPSTVLHVNVPNRLSLHRRLGVEQNLMRSLDDSSDRQRSLQQRSFYDRATLKAEVEDAGFTTTEFGGYFLKPFAAQQMADMLAADIITADTVEALVGLGEQLPELASELWCEATVT